MREILFRGKRKDNGEWVYGRLLYFKASVGTEVLALIVESCEWDNSNEWFNLGKRARVIPESVGQYTGLTDKNGNMIFEGDIVNDEQSGYNYFIKWFPEYACFSLADKNGNMEFGCDEFEIFLNDLIVIGNIYDNPELLKGE